MIGLRVMMFVQRWCFVNKGLGISRDGLKLNGFATSTTLNDLGHRTRNSIPGFLILWELADCGKPVARIPGSGPSVG